MALPMPQVPVRLDIIRFDNEVLTAMPGFEPETVTTIGWRSIGDHTVFIRQQVDRYGYRIRVADDHGRYTATLESKLRFESEEAAFKAAKDILNANTNTGK